MSIRLFQPSLRELDGLAKVVKFKCNGCSRKTDFIWLDQFDTAEGFRVYQCKDCGCVGTKNLAEATDTQEPVKRCNKCGSWMFADMECATCAILSII